MDSSHVDWPTAILALANTLAVALAIIKQRETKKQIEDTHKEVKENTALTNATRNRVEEVGKAVNGRMEQLLSAYSALAKIGSTTLEYQENERATKAKNILGQKDARIKALTRLLNGCEDGQCKVLVVEDNQLDYDILVRVLQRMGFSSSHARNSNEAIGCITQYVFDAIFVDLVMPGGVDGYEFVKLMSVLAPSIPVFVVTGYVDKSVDQALRIIGASGVFEKPLSFDRLKDMLEKAVKDA